ncbi:MAG TPA: hypothetical protein VHE30_07700 [Polyangiaceae bacterium]|nr:hypothetical protein [Polyangiaceae bacterium]
MNGLMGSSPNRMVMLQFKPLWGYIDDVRDFCAKFVSRGFGDGGVGEHVGMIVHELVENAIRHGDERELVLRIERTEDALVVCVANTTTDERAAELRRVVAELAKWSPEEGYQRALGRCTQLPKSSGGLGLPRIRYEGRAELQVDVAPGRVSLMARTAV